MARRASVTQTGNGTSSTVALDTYSPLTSLAIVVSGGPPNYTVQHTLDDVLNSAVTPTWFDHDTLVAQTTNQDGNYAYPVAGVRLVINSGGGVATLTILQAGGTVL